jgi:hypothetical protein
VKRSDESFTLHLENDKIVPEKNKRGGRRVGKEVL